MFIYVKTEGVDLLCRPNLKIGVQGVNYFITIRFYIKTMKIGLGVEEAGHFNVGFNVFGRKKYEYKTAINHVHSLIVLFTSSLFTIM